ncbi:MAG TPA: hypothetical protein PLP76_09855, partial [Bacteroidales bacterium]|nr:hypothetical protein [Bacteroidales bacterium]
SGIFLQNPNSGVNILHNSVYMYGTGNASAFYTYNSSTSYKPIIKNNNFVTEAGSSAYPIYYNGSYSNVNYFNVDYNNYYSSGSNVGYAGGDQTSIEGLRAATGQDIHSVSKSQFYYDYPNSAKVYGFDLSCPPLSLVTTDIENVTRTTPTTMGAYHFTPYLAYDIQPYALVTPSGVLMNGVKETVSIELMNVGDSTITSATIDWSFNGTARSTVNWTGNLASGSTVTVTLDTILPVGGINSLEIITSAPNAQTDTMPFNDTLRVNLFACDSMLSGVYTVGTAGKFSTLEDAMLALQNCGVKDAVTLLLDSGDYPPIAFSGTILGTSTTNTITITSASGTASDVTIGSSTSSAITALSLTDVSHLIFKDITIGLNSSNTGIAVELSGMCENVLFYGCNIQTHQNGTGTNYCGVKYYNSSGSTKYLKDVRFIKNNVDGGYYNFWVYYGAGTSANMASTAMSVTIDSNIMTNAYYAGIYSYEYARYNSISYNTITSRTSGSVTSTWYGIYLSWDHNVESIIGNKIQSTNTGIGYPRGIYIYYYFNSPSYSGSGSGLIANNEIILRTTSSYYGIYLYNPYSNVNVLHNSVYMYGTGSAYAMYFYNSSSSYQPVLKNNNFVTVAGSSAYPIYYNSSYYNTSYVTVDYNNYYSSGSYVGYAGSARTTLAALQTATLQDANSMNSNPGFAAVPTDLIPANWLSCPIIADVPTDITGELRIMSTYIGCYTAVFTLDAGIVEYVGIGGRSTAGLNPINVKIINMGKDTLTSLSVRCEIDGVQQSPVNLTGLSLAQYQDTIVTVGSFTAVTGVTTNIKTWTFSPNGLTDQNNGNDTLAITTEGCALVLYGTYDVGGGNNDFSTIAAAMSALTSCGVSGPVVLRLATGTYNSLSSFTTVYYGTSETNTVTFTSLAGDADSVVIGAATGVALTLNGAKYLRFDKVTIGNTNGNTTYGVNFLNTNECIDFYGCNINSSTSTISSNYACVYYDNSSGSTNTLKNVRFIKNDINGGYYNFYMNYPAGGSTNIRNMSVTIDSNIIRNAYYYGIRSYEYACYPSISYNTITSRTSGSVSSYWYGLYLSWDHNVEKIVGNTIKSTHTSIYYPYGMYIYYYFNSTSYSGSGSGLIANNEIILRTTSSYYGIYLYNPYSNVKVLHNSVYMYGSGSAYALYTYNGSSSYKPEIKNNIFMTNASTTAYPIYYNGNYSSSYYTTDYNNYYSSGNYVGYAGSALTSLLALQGATGQDANSISENPNFIDPTVDLHTSGISMLIDPISALPYDKNGLARVPVTNMGCYHDFEPEDNDAKMVQIVSPGSSVSIGVSTPITVKIMNFGVNNLDSVTFNWIVNGGALNTMKYDCDLAFGVTSPAITLGSFIPISGLNTLLVYTTNPNGVPDENTSDDTLTYSVYACDSMLNGIYTIDSGGDFASLDVAFMALKNCGVNGPVELRMATGTYPGLTIDTEFPGTSSTRTITITSATGNATDVIFNADYSNALVLNGAKDLKFEKVSFGNTTNSLTGVTFINTNTNIEFYECNIYASLSNTSNSCAAVYYNNTSGSTNTLKDVRFIKNTIDGGYSNFWFNYPAGGSSNMSNMSVTIDSNIMKNSYYYALYAYYYGSYPSISYNTITSRNSGLITSTWYGLRFYYYNNVEKIEGNRIISTNTNIMYPYGMYIYYYFNSPSYYGSGSSLIANNEIILYTISSYYGIYLYNPYSNVELLHNSIYMYGTGSAYALYTYNSSTSYQPVFKNNIFTTAAATTAYPIYYNGNYGSSYYTTDYNNYYSTGANIAYAGSAISSLSGLQSATGQDANSLNQNPNFLLPTTSLNTDGFEMLVPPLVNVPYDIDGKSRGFVTNIGCYHDFDPYDDDAKMVSFVSPVGGVVVGQSTPLTVTLMNMGLHNLDSVRIHWSVNNGPVDSVNYYCNLAFGAISSNITLDTFIPVGGTNSFRVYTTLPNGTADEFPINDTIQTTAFGCDSILSGVYTVGTGGDLANVYEAVTALYQCGIKGPVEFRFMAGSYGNLTFNQNVPGSSTTNTITFTSLSGNPGSVTFASLGDVALTFDNVSNFIFKNVTLNATLGTHAVEFKNTCSNIVLYGCNIIADPTTTQTYAGIYRNGTSGSSASLSNIRIIKNNISGGYYNIYWYYGGGSSSYMGSGCYIDSNVCTNAYYYGINLHYSYTNFNSVSYNKVICRSSNSSSNFYGIRFYYYNNIGEVVGNKVYIRNTAVNYAYPMYIYYYNNYTNNPFGSMLVANNELISEAGSYSYGLYVYNYSLVNVINNSIYGSASSTAYGLYLYTTSTTYPIVAKNNNAHVANASTGYPLYISSTTYASSSYVTLDYNNYYNANYVGYVGGARTTLTQLRSATGQDVNSVSALPSYVNLSNSLELNDYSNFLCQRLSSVLTDINGESRTDLTTMGAYSVYVYNGYDMALTSIVEPINTDEVACYQDFASIKVAVANRGSLPIDFTVTPMILHVDVQGAVNFQADTIISVGTLTATKKDTIKITDLLPVSSNGSYYITAWLELVVDALPEDDTVQSVYIIDKNSIPYTINFDTMPSGMVFKQFAGSSGWTVESGDGVNPIISPSHGSGRLQFLSESGRGSMARATLQPFNLKGSVSPQMKFWYAHDDGNPMSRDYTEVKISIDGGTTYFTLLNLQRYNAAYATPTFVRYEIDLSPYTTYSCVILAFEAGSYGGGNQNIDSIAIISKQDLSLELIVTEQSEFVACELDNK